MKLGFVKAVRSQDYNFPGLHFPLLWNESLYKALSSPETPPLDCKWSAQLAGSTHRDGQSGDSAPKDSQDEKSHSEESGMEGLGDHFQVFYLSPITTENGLFS